MRVNKIDLVGFKNLGDSFILSPGVNIIIGSNGIGKTNFLESVYYLSRGRSFRHKSDTCLISNSSDTGFAQIKAEVSEDSGENDAYVCAVGCIDGALKKKYSINGISIPVSRYEYKLPCILFLPQDVDLLSSSPETRRSEIDDYIKLLFPDSRRVFLDYKKIIKTRNRLLKYVSEGISRVEELNYWNEGVVEAGSTIIFLRAKVLAKLLPKVKELSMDLFYEDLRGLSFRYVSKFIEEISTDIKEDQIREKFRKKIKENIQKEVRAGLTLYGPQRDDIEFIENNINLSEFASRGQQRLISLIFKLAMWKLYEEEYKKRPVLLLDDLMSELDEKHRENLERVLENLGTQVVITDTSKKHFSRRFLSKINHIEIN